MLPLIATPRDPTLATDGPLVAVIADALGTPLMPWQVQVADVAGERNPDGSYRWPIVFVSVPRQSGKTTLIRARAITRCVTRARQSVHYTAQTGKDARERWRDLTKQIQASPMRSVATIRQGTGAERVTFPNGSEFRVFAPVPTALHGYTPSEVYLDEAWAHDALRGEALMGAIVPAQITVHDRQLWIVSTAGTADSVFLRQWWDAALDGAPGLAAFIWGAAEGLDPYDPATWRTFHPALGHTLYEPDLQAAAAAHTQAEFERAYCNRWTRTAQAIIPAEVWAALAARQTPPPPGSVALAYDVAHDRASACIVAAWLDGEQVPQVRVVRHDHGYAWLADEVPALSARLSARAVGATDDGPARTITEQLAAAGTEVRVLRLAEYANACGEFLSEVRLAHLAHDASPVLAEAVANAITRPQGDLWGWSRRNSRGPIAPLVAATTATWLARHLPEPSYAPFIRLGPAQVDR